MSDFINSKTQFDQPMSLKECHKYEIGVLVVMMLSGCKSVCHDYPFFALYINKNVLQFDVECITVPVTFL